MKTVLRSCFEKCSANLLRGEGWMFRGTLITDLFDAVERAEISAKSARLQNRNAEIAPLGKVDLCRCQKEKLEAEKLPQSLGLSAADGDLSLLFVVHPELIRTLEPGNDFADAIDIHQVGAVGPPKKIRV